MTTVLIVGVFVLASPIAWLVLRRYRPGRGHEKPVADDALREVYGQYWAEVRAVVQAHLLEAPADEEWLDGIRERALYADIAGWDFDEPVRQRPRRTTLLRWLAGVAGVLLVPAVVFFAHPAAGVFYLILAVFFIGVTLGVVAMVAVGIRREDRLYSLSDAAPSAAARGTRWLTRFGGAGSHFQPSAGYSDEGPWPPPS